MLPRYGFPGFELLFPHLAGLAVEKIEQAATGIVVWVGVHGPGAACPGCGTVSARRHGGYRRTVRDAPVSDQPVLLRLASRRFKCVNPGCEAVTFAEQIPQVTSPFGRLSRVPWVSVYGYRRGARRTGGDRGTATADRACRVPQPP